MSVGVLVTTPAPLPESATDRIGLKPAVTAAAPVIVTLQVVWFVPQPFVPAQPVKTVVLSATSVRVTTAPDRKDAEQAVFVLPQLIPVAGLELVTTLVLSGPVVETVSV